MLHEALSLRASIGKKLRMWEAKKYRYYQFGCERSEQDLERNSEASGECSSLRGLGHGKHPTLDLRQKAAQPRRTRLDNMQQYCWALAWVAIWLTDD